MSDATAQTEAGTEYPPAWRGWMIVTLLMIAYIFSYLDRSIIGYLATPIKEDLGITDEQFGWVTGAAFAIFYSTMAIPLGWLVDRKRRMWIISGGIAVWSIATVFCGLATKYWHLFLARVAVGAGEATLSPSAMSIIGDSFEPKKRGKPIAMYTMALVLGGAVAGYIVAIALRLTKDKASFDLPMIGEVAPWQMTFIAIGLPGVLLAVVFFFMQEPPRHTEAVMDEDPENNGFKDTLVFLGKNWGTFVGFVSLASVMTIIAYSQGFFLPSVFEKTYGWSNEKYAWINATGTLVIGVAIYPLIGYLADMFTKRENFHGPFNMLAVGFLMMVPTGVLANIMPNGWIAFAVLTICNIGIMIISAVGVTALLLITPSKIRGQIVAFYYMAISITGALLGPTVTGTLSTRVYGEDNVNLAVATVPVIFGLIPLILLPIIRRLYLTRLDKLMVSAETS